MNYRPQREKTFTHYMLIKREGNHETNHRQLVSHDPLNSKFSVHCWWLYYSTRQCRHFNNDNCLQILLCQYCVFQCAPTHIHTQSHTYIYKWTMSYKNLHIPCFAIFIFSAASLRSINSIFEHKSALDMLYWLYPWQLLRTSPTKNKCLQWESQTICLKYAVTFCII